MNSATTRKVLQGLLPPRFVNPGHKERLRRRLATQAAELTASTATSRQLLRTTDRIHFALAAAAAVVIGVASLLTVMPSQNLFARAIEAASKFPVVHYRVTRRALPNSWGVVFDPRQPLTANDEVWVHLGDESTPAQIRSESGLAVGDRFVRLIRGGEIITYKPASRWAWKTTGDSAPFLRIGPMSVVASASSLDRSAYVVRTEEGKIVAVASVERSEQPAGRIPIRLDELKTRRTFVFDEATGLLRRVRIEGFWESGWMTLALIDRIEYLDFDPAVFRLDLPADIVWSNPAPIAPAHSIGSGSPEDTAKLFLRAWVEQDAPTLRAIGGGTPYDKLLSPQRTGSPAPVEVVSVGTPERDSDGIYPGVWVPYAVRFPDGRVKRHRMALKQRPNGVWYVDGGI